MAGRPALLESNYRQMTRSPWARWMTITNGFISRDVLAYVTETHYIGYAWPLPDDVWKDPVDGLPGWGDAKCFCLPRSSTIGYPFWTEVSGTTKEEGNV